MTTGSTAVALSTNDSGSASASNGGAGYPPLEEVFDVSNITFDAAPFRCLKYLNFIPDSSGIFLNFHSNTCFAKSIVFIVFPLSTSGQLLPRSQA